MLTSSILVDEAFLPRAIDLVTLAQRELYISTFKAELTTKPRGRRLTKFFEQVFAASWAGLDVRFLLNRTVPRGTVPLSNFHAIQVLQKHGVHVRCLRGDRVCHAKLLIADNAAAIFGSHNLSVKSCHNNFEISYLFTDPSIVDNLRTVYLSVWDKAQRP